MANLTEAKKKNSQIKKFFRDIRAELKKVAWPTKRELVSYLITVCVAIAIVCILLFILDQFFGLALAPILR